MKKKDLIYLSVSIAIIGVAIFLVVSQGGSGGKKQAGGPTVEVVQPIDPTYDQSILAQIDPATSGDSVRNFAVKVNLKTELGNHNLFGR